MKNLTIFRNEQFGEIRTITKGNEPWFVGKDIAEALGYVDTKSALSDHVDAEDKKILKGGDLPLLNFAIPNRGLTFINESGVYSLVFSSKLPQAKAFKRWVTSEVLPAIRKTGSYGTAIKEKEVEAKLNNSRARLNNSRARMAAIILRCAKETKSETYKEICNKNAVNVLNGKEIMPMLPTEELTLSAKDVGEKLGITGNMVGRIANQHGLKTEQYGKWYHTTAQNNDKKEVDTFRYYPSVVDVIRRLLENSVQ